MANRYRNLIYSTAEYTQAYGGFRGVELNADSLIGSTARLAYAKNMYKDYDGDGAEVIESIPGFRCFAHYGNKINGIYYQRSLSGGEDHIIVHAGGDLMRHPVSDIYSKNAVGVRISGIADTKSFGFEFGRYFYIMDTAKIIRIDGDGKCVTVGESGAMPYIPTTYVSGEAYEQRNMLTRRFIEEFYVVDPREYLFTTGGLSYTVTDQYERYCSVSRPSAEVKGDLYIPAYVNIGGVEYKVVSINNYAFEKNTSLTSVFIPDGITDIGAYAFSGCTGLKTLVMSSTVETIGEYAFSGCSSLELIYMESSVSKIGVNAFYNTAESTVIHYSRTPTELMRIDGYSEIKDKTFMYVSKYERIVLSIPLMGNVEELIKAKVNGEDMLFDYTDDGITIKSVVIEFPSIKDATGIHISIEGKYTPLDADRYLGVSSDTGDTVYEAVIGCRTAEVFDGRIFLSGNPSFPNTVFYTEGAFGDTDGALYVGVYNYFTDGVGSYKVKSMLSVRDMLAVFKEGDDGSGSIFYHKRETVANGPVGTVYPVAYVHCGICSEGGCLSFLDDPVFLARDGLMALNGENINYQRNVVCRSHNVNYSLLKEDLSSASLCEWLGYLAVGINGKVFLADSRATFIHPCGSREYEWFMLEDIGVYSDDHVVYRYSPDGYGDAIAHPTKVSKIADYQDVYSVTDEDGMQYYYVTENGAKYRVIPTEERSGGSFSPASLFISHGKRLFFATENGHICVFNNDMRGVAPDSIKESPDYDDASYTATMGTKLHPLFYSFAGHAPSYVVKTALDNCGIPHLTKSTVKKSLVIKAKSYAPDAIDCSVSVDGCDPVFIGNFPSGEFSFGNFDFGSAPWYTTKYSTVAMPEKQKRWVEKQLLLTSSVFASPISLYSISYRYFIKGKIKNDSR